MDDRILEDLINKVISENLHVLNVVVRKDGDIIARHDFEVEKPVLLWSVSKTFTSMAVGIAVEEGLFQLDDHVIDYFPDYISYDTNGYIKQLTIHDLLCMASGHAECPVAKADWAKGKQWDITELFFKEPFVYKPGTYFAYDNSATYILSKIISIRTNRHLDIYLNEKVFQYLDIPKPRWDTCPLGIPQGFSGLHLTAGYLSVFGQLILNKGKWKGRRIIPAHYIEQAISAQIDTHGFNPYFATADHHQGYGYQIWRNSYPNSYRMDGSLGQYVVMLPDKKAVVTLVSDERERMTDVLELTWNTLVDKL